ncbi:MAG: phenylalanine--tRNA ligase subunit beta [Patescibacteria group bacterium]
MKLPINWLKDYIELPADQKDLMMKLTSIGHMQDGPPKEVAGDTVYDMEIRQNRSDCLSILGLAMEASAVLDKPVTFPEHLELPAVTSERKVEIENTDLCYRFETVKIDNLKIAPSPDWMKQKLEAYGIKSINNVVDITNFVMVEIGEPMHAYDIREVKGAFHIRNAQKGEKLSILGGKEVVLTEDDLVIADDEKILSLAGIIGGEHSGVKVDTTSIILEDATYNQGAIRRTSIRHQVRTEASTRHEKFLHPIMTTVALQRAVKLFVDLCGGTVSDHTDTYPSPVDVKKVALDINNLNKLAGFNLSLEESSAILKKLQMVVSKTSDNSLEAEIPCTRTDITQEADLIEEVLRIYGYDNIPAALPNTPPPTDLQVKTTYDIEQKIKDVLTASGYDEQITEPLTNKAEGTLEPVKLENSLNADKTMLRTSLRGSLERAFSNQQKHRKTDIRIFEVGKIYYKADDQYKEEKIIAGMSSYKENSVAAIKGVLEELFDRLNFDFSEDIITIEAINSTTFYFELKLNDLLKQPQLSFTANLHTSPPQVILQDLSLAAPQTIKVGDVIRAIHKTSPLVYKIKLGEFPQNMPSGEKTIFLNVTFFSPSNPISNQDVEAEREQIREMLEKDFLIRIR